jgi:hypothetical protein
VYKSQIPLQRWE